MSTDNIINLPTTKNKKGFSAMELMSMEIPPMKWAIPELLPEGVTLLGGKPKTGKSWMSLALCVATAKGCVALGTRHVDQGDALYLALEDNPRRLQDRLGKVLVDGEAPENFELYLEWPRLDGGGTEKLDEWLTVHPNARLVVIDTLAKIRKPAKGQNVYKEDYEALEALLPLAAKHNVAIVVVHHTSKREDADDPLDELSGSTGLIGGVDSALILKKSKGKADTELYIRGRDVEEQELALEWDQEISGFRIIGEAADYKLSDTRFEIKRALQNADEPLGPKQIAEKTNLDYDNVKNTCSRMAKKNQIHKDGHGRYTVTSDTFSSISHKYGEEKVTGYGNTLPAPVTFPLESIEEGNSGNTPKEPVTSNCYLLNPIDKPSTDRGNSSNEFRGDDLSGTGDLVGSTDSKHNDHFLKDREETTGQMEHGSRTNTTNPITLEEVEEYIVNHVNQIPDDESNPIRKTVNKFRNKELSGHVLGEDQIVELITRSILYGKQLNPNVWEQYQQPVRERMSFILSETR